MMRDLGIHNPNISGGPRFPNPAIDIYLDVPLSSAGFGLKASTHLCGS